MALGPRFALTLRSMRMDHASETGVVSLITEGKAMLPPAAVEKGPAEASWQDPLIVIWSPVDGQAYDGPFVADVFLRPRGAVLNLTSFKVAYLAVWGIDITERLRPYLRNRCPSAQNAKAPPRNSRINLSIAEVAGNMAAKGLRLVIG